MTTDSKEAERVAVDAAWATITAYAKKYMPRGRRSDRYALKLYPLVYGSPQIAAEKNGRLLSTTNERGEEVVLRSSISEAVDLARKEAGLAPAGEKP